MKVAPAYPDYHPLRPPLKQRWGVVTLAICLFCSLLTVWLWPVNKPIQGILFWFWFIGFPLLLMGLLFSVRYLIYQIALSNRQNYRAVLQQATKVWWQKRSQGLPLEQIYLLGPAGDHAEHHLAAVESRVTPPSAIVTSGEKLRLRCPQVLESDIALREKALTRHLVKLIQNTRKEYKPTIDAFYWLGSSACGQYFIEHLARQGWKLPETINFINNIEDLDTIIDYYHAFIPLQACRLLCAGVYLAENDNIDQISGEAGFAWVINNNGQCTIRRAERQDSEAESPGDVTRQVMQYAGIASPPQACVSLSKAAAEAFQISEWPSAQIILEPFWEDLQIVAPFIALSVAAIVSIEKQKTCGWLARDENQKNIIGAITVDEER